MSAKPPFALAILCGIGLGLGLGLGAEVRAADQVKPDDAAKLPTLALNSQQALSPWTGLYAGTEVFAISRKGSKGLVGGGAFIGYNREGM